MCLFKYPHCAERNLICLFHSKQTLTSWCQKYPRLPLLPSQHCLQVPSPWKWSPLHEAVIGPVDYLAEKAAWPISHMHLGDFQTDAYASSLSWQEGWEFKDSGGEFMPLWKLNPSWKRHKRVYIKDMTFCLLLESVACCLSLKLWQLSLWTGDFHCPELSGVYFIFNNNFQFICIYCPSQRCASLFKKYHQ